MINQRIYIRQMKVLEITAILFIVLLLIIACGSGAEPDETDIQATIDAAVIETVQSQTTTSSTESSSISLAATPIPSTPTSVPPTATSIPPTPTPAPPTATPNLDTILPEAASLCEAALSSSQMVAGTAQPPILALYRASYYEPGEWELSASESPFIGATSASDVKSIICIYEKHNKVGTYTDGTSAQQIQWDVWALSWPEGSVITSTTLYGGSPPNVKKFWGTGSPPFEAYREWMAQNLRLFPGGILSHNTIVSNLKFLPDGSTLIAEGAGKVSIWNIDDEKLISALDASALVTLSDGKMLAVVANKWSVALIDVETEQTLWSYDISKDGLESPYNFTFSEDGKTLFAVGGYKEGQEIVYLWDVETGLSRMVSFEELALAHNLSFSPDGTWLASGNDDGTVFLWEVSTWTEMYSYKAHTDEINAIEFSPDGKIIASASKDNTIRLWDIELEKEIQVIPFTVDVDFGTINSLAFSPDGKLLAAGTSDPVVRLWDAETGQKIQNFTGHIKEVEGVTFSPDGNILVSGSDDGIIKLWKMTDIENQ